MLAKLTVKNQLTLPKSVTQSLGPVQYFEVQEKAGQIILTPVRIQRGDALRAKLAELEIDVKTIESALGWAGKAQTQPRVKKELAAEPLPALKKTRSKPLSGSTPLAATSDSRPKKPALKTPASTKAKASAKPVKTASKQRISTAQIQPRIKAGLAKPTLKKALSVVRPI
ncbi:hypothetical protein [Roseateles koreensis]|uniref:SpoVT-AbrB domain-containing protein n=1 Tax=Roseateles koreensis TaxID=2987526 RepID=A0ABT5KUB2_9BURK|nr:hypothetical protein [Roseateles koreensis]MDC8786527.1 hypothetical protein [Roseateles koreensis]